MKTVGKRVLWVMMGSLLLLLTFPILLIVREYRQRQRDEALIQAIQHNDSRAVWNALYAGADPNARTASAPSSLWQYLRARWQQMRRGKRSPNPIGPTALTLAVEQNSTEAVEALLTRGAKDVGEKLQAADGDFENESICTLSMYAACKNNGKILRALARRGSDVHTRDANHKTALFYATGKEAVQALRDCGADLNAKDVYQFTALDLNLRSNNTEVSEALIECGARDAKAMEFAIFFGQTEALQKMLDSGWDINSRGENGVMPLMHALYSPGHLEPEAALMLIKHGADVNSRDYEDRATPLHLAADGGRYPDMDEKSPEVVNALLDRGAHINAQTRGGETALMVASFRLRPRLVELLLHRGANVHLKTKEGETALSMAHSSPYKQTHRGCLPQVIRLLTRAARK
jgi:ankyrin repeat protein